MMLGRAAKIPSSIAFGELVDMDFADYGDYSELIRIPEDDSRFHVVVLTVANERVNKLSKWSANRRFRICWRRLGRLELLLVKI